eukprot:461125-Rhodomonas_salina.3
MVEGGVFVSQVRVGRGKGGGNLFVSALDGKDCARRLFTRHLPPPFLTHHHRTWPSARVGQ